jgi:predicted outer membrane repeat protein
MLMALEDRRLLATFHVTRTVDDRNVGTLRWAVQQANLATSPSTIDFELGQPPSTIGLLLGSLELSNIAEPTMIDGPGASLLTIDGNKADRVFTIDPRVTASLSGLTITGGATIDQGGGVYNAGAAALTNCTISGNSSGYGGGLLSKGTLSLDACSISGNSASVEGGGVWTAGTATLTACAIMGNASGDIGGGLNNRSATLTLDACTISGNSAEKLGGGIYNQDMVTLSGCTISGNTAVREGGGLVTGINSVSTLTACTINGNASEDGGGLENYSRTMLTNCTLSGNSASASGGGVSNSGTATLMFCTISGNVTSVSGGGLYNHDFLDSRGRATLTDTIVAANTATGGAPSDIGGGEAASVTGSFDLIGTGGSGGILAGGRQGNIILASLAGLGLAPLGDYGGPTQTVALLPGSPALEDGANMTGLATDQRGEPFTVSVDIGAFQSQGFFVTAAPGSTPQSAPTGETFAEPLAVTIEASNPVEPVIGGFVTFTVAPEANGGAAADLSATTAVIGANDRAQVSAIANAKAGTYVITASTADALRLPQFILTNLLATATRATPKVDVAAAGGTAVFGQPVSFVTSVTATGTPSGSVTFFDGTVLLGTVLLDGSGRATLTSSLAVGSHSITASYSGDSSFFGRTSAIFTESVAEASTKVVLVRHPVFKHKQVVSVRLTAEVDPLAPGQGIPSGTLKFMIKKKKLGTLALGGGTATLTLKLNNVLNRAVTVVYSGDGNFQPSQAATPALTQASLATQAGR